MYVISIVQGGMKLTTCPLTDLWELKIKRNGRCEGQQTGKEVIMIWLVLTEWNKGYYGVSCAGKWVHILEGDSSFTSDGQYH